MSERSAAVSQPSFALAELLERFGGQCAADGDQRITGFATLATAGPGQLAFLTASRYRADVPMSRAAAVLVKAADADGLVADAHRLWVCADPYLQFARIAQFLEAAATRPAGSVDPTAVVHDDAIVDATATIGPGAVVGRGARIGARVRIGAGTIVGDDTSIADDGLLHASVVIYPRCVLGARCIVHSGAVIGADGFGFAKDGAAWVKIPQVGGVVIGDDVEIGANTTIDRGTLDDTRIGHGVKLDNQIQIAHNVEIGDHTIMAACVGVAGSAVIGMRCMIGGAARIMGHITIADGTVISTQTFVSRSITKAAQYTGYYPMAEHAAFEKSAAVLRRLDRLRERVRRLESADVPDGRDSPPLEGKE